MTTSIESSSSGKNDIVINKIQNDFVVISWNVLHLIHEINYVYDMSPVIDRYSIRQNWSNEQRRLDDMVKILNELLIKHSTKECFICLQEVPGDLIPLLRAILTSQVGSTLSTMPLIHIQTYSRKPWIKKRQGNPPYTDVNESLVTIHYNPYIDSSNTGGRQKNAGTLLSEDRILWTPCPSDNGKGALAVITTSGLTVVNIHVPSDNKVAMQLLNNIPWPENSNPFVLVGDMNRDSNALMRMINKITVGKPSAGLIFPVPTDKPTRVGYWQDGTLHKTWLDHYLITASLRNLIVSPPIVYDHIGDISDHYPVLLEFKHQ